MTRKEAIDRGVKIANSGYGELAEMLNFVNAIYNDIEEYLEKAMMESRTWDAHVALHKVKKYLEGKDE